MSAALSNDRSKKAYPWGLPATIALIFLVPGVLMGVILGQNLLAAQKIQDWPVVEARILEVKLSKHVSLGALRRSGGINYLAEARYEYSWQGRRYESTRVGVDSGNDNFGSVQFDRVAIMKQHRAAGTPMQCRVDPSNPSNAVLFPKVRLVFVLVFGIAAFVFSGIGFGIIFFLVIKILQERSFVKRLEQHSGEPWLARKEWAMLSVPNGAQKFELWRITGFAIGWNLLWWEVSFLMAKNRMPFTYPPRLLVSLFLLVGVVIACVAVLEYFRYARLGKIRFEIPSGPGRIGGELAGSIQIPVPVDTAAPVEIQLTCQRVRDTRSRRDGIASTEEALAVLKNMPRCYPNEMIWSVDIPQPMIQSQGGMGVSIPVRAEIPGELPPSTIEQRGDGDIAWKLYVRVKTNGPDLIATFEVPVLGS